MIEYRGLEFAPGYRVGDDGSVWSRKNARWGLRDEWRRLKSAPDAFGYPSVAIMLPAKERKQYRVGVLVLLVFVGPAPDGTECCHENGNPADSRLSNLRWDTRRSNVADALRHGRMRVGSRSNLAKLTEQKVAEILTSPDTGRELARRYEVSEGTISMIRARKIWKHVAVEGSA